MFYDLAIDFKLARVMDSSLSAATWPHFMEHYDLKMSFYNHQADQMELCRNVLQ